MIRFGRYVRLMMTFDDESGGEGSGGGGGGGEGNPNPGGSDGLGQPSPSQGTLNPPASNPWDAVPRAWAQEHHPLWERTPAEVRQVIHAREQAVDKGIRSYYDGHQRWNQLSGVFQEYTQQDPNLDVGQVYEALARNHLALVKAPPEQRRQLFTQMAKYYGVDFAEAAAGGSADPNVQELVQQAVQQYVQPLYAERQQQYHQRVEAAVDTFFSDPQNEFVSDERVAQAMLQSVKGGVRDLRTAYEMACLGTPEVKAKYLAKLAGSAAGGQGEGTPSGDRNLKSSGGGAPSGKPKTIDDTMAEIAEKHFGKS